MDDLSPTGAGEPDESAVPPAVQVSAPLMLIDKGHQGGEGAWHGAGRLPQGERVE